MHPDTRIFGEPVEDFLLLVGGVVVHHQAQLLIGISPGDVLEEGQEFLGHPDLHRQGGRGAIQGLDLALLIDTEHDRVLGGSRYSPTMSVTLATSSGSVEI